MQAGISGIGFLLKGSVMTRRKDVNWTLPDGTVSVEQAQLAVMMDIRDELKELNRRLDWRFSQMPNTLDRIDRRLREHMPLKQGRKRG
jgi:hypothetical protein